jgi:hypothetical protein
MRTEQAACGTHRGSKKDLRCPPPGWVGRSFPFHLKNLANVNCCEVPSLWLSAKGQATPA